MTLDTVIIGAGPAGLTAAIYAVRAGLTAEVLEQNMYGGQIVNTPSIDNYPGLPGVSGHEFASALYKQATDLGAIVTLDPVVEACLTGDVKTITLEDRTISAKTVIVATGAKPVLLGCPGEERLTGTGVSYCATCDGAFYRGKDVAVVGGGNTAIEEALVLSGLCNKVHLIHRRKGFRAEKHMLDALRAKPNVEWITDAVVEEIRGDNAVSAVTVKDVLNGQKRDIPVSAIFVSIGSKPDNRIFASELALDEGGYVIADESCVTNVPGVFVAGDTRTKKVRQMVTAAADGAVAALAASEFIAEM